MLANLCGSFDIREGHGTLFQRGRRAEKGYNSHPARRRGTPTNAVHRRCEDMINGFSLCKMDWRIENEMYLDAGTPPPLDAHRVRLWPVGSTANNDQLGFLLIAFTLPKIFAQRNKEKNNVLTANK